VLKTTSSRLALALLGYVILIILVLTFNPFYLAIPNRIKLDLEAYPPHMLENVILFLPVGFLYRLTTKRRGAWLLGALISIVIESAQIFVPARGTSPIDVLTNTLGAGVGALFYDLLSPRMSLTQKTIGRLRLETPLMSFVYLLIPLLWVNGLALADSNQRWQLTFLIGICGAIVFNDVYRNWLDSKGPRLIIYVSLSTGVWFLFGTGINLLHPFPSLWVILAVVLIAAILSIMPRRFAERRFEHSTLQRLIPIFALYIILLALWPPNQPFTDWHGMIGMSNQVQAGALRDLTPRIEYVVAFSILGYLTTEWRGRAELTVTRDLPGLLAVAGVSALVLEILVGFQAGMGASLVRFVLATMAALYGGAIYHFLRDHIRFLSERNDRAGNQ
jgi:hypothetical protein